MRWILVRDQGVGGQILSPRPIISSRYKPFLNRPKSSVDNFVDSEILRVQQAAFRIYGMLRNDARTRVGEYVRLAWKVVNENPSPKVIAAAIRGIGKEFTIEDAVAKLREANCYEGWENELRYFMFRYEEHLSRQEKLNFSNEQWEKIWMVSPSESIEHIWAKRRPLRLRCHARRWYGKLQTQI